MEEEYSKHIIFSVSSLKPEKDPLSEGGG